MKNKFFTLWITWTILGASLLYGVASSISNNSIVSILAMVLSLSPLLGLTLALGSLKASRQFSDWLRADKNSLYYTVGGISLLFAIPGLLTGNFNSYYTIYKVVFGFCFVNKLTHAQKTGGQVSLSYKERKFL